MPAKPPMSSSQPLGSSSGWALDVIVVAPSSKTANTGVAASSDFYASFPASLAKARKNLLTSTSKRLASFVNKKSISDVSSSSVGSGEGLISERDKLSSTMPPSVTKGNVQVCLNGRYISKLDMHFTKNNSSSCCRFVHGNGLRPAAETLQAIIDGTYEDGEVDESTCSCSEAVKNSEHHICAKTNIPREAHSTEPILSFGKNLIRYTLVSDSGAAIAYTEANIYLWSALDSVIVSDIDGTITKDNIGGVMDTVVQEKFEHIHNGICKFYQDLSEISRVEDMNALNSSDTGDGQVRFMYLSSRPITLVSNTRKLLVSVSQKCEAQEFHHLPPGPMMCNIVPLSSVLYSELVSKSVHIFKSDVLARQVVLPFVAARGEDRNVTKTAKSSQTLSTTEIDDTGEYTNVRSLSDGINQTFIEKKDSVLKDDRLFLAGFGNTIRDAMAYEMAGMDRDDIYIIDTKSRIMCMGEQSCEGQSIEDLDQDCIPDTAWVSDVAVAACCLGSSGESQLIPSDEQCNGGSQNVVNETNLRSQTSDSSRAIFDEPRRDDSGDSHKRSKRKTPKANGSVPQSIRAFTNKKSFAKFPSFASSSSKSSKSSSKKVLYQGYDDPRLLQALRKRIQGEYDPFTMHTKDG